MSYARCKLTDAQLAPLARDVWTAVTVTWLARWSRLSDARGHLIGDICQLLGAADTPSRRRRIGAALRELHEAGALIYRPASGRDPAIIALPDPPDEWTDPSCGRTAGELRAAADPRDRDGGVPPREDRGVPATRGTPHEGVPEGHLPRAREASRHRPPVARRTAKPSRRHDPPTPDATPNLGPVTRRVLDALPSPVAAEITAHRRIGQLDTLIAQLADDHDADRVVARLTGHWPANVQSPYALLRSRADELQRAITARQNAAAAADQARRQAAIEHAPRWATTILPHELPDPGDPGHDREVTDRITARYPYNPDAQKAAHDAYRAWLADDLLADADTEPVMQPTDPVTVAASWAAAKVRLGRLDVAAAADAAATKWAADPAAVAQAIAIQLRGGAA